MAIQNLAYSNLLNYINVSISETQTNSRYLPKHSLIFNSRSEFAIWASSKGLNNTEKKLLEIIYFGNVSMSGLAKKLGVSRQFIQQKHLDILGKVRDDLRNVA